MEEDPEINDGCCAHLEEQILLIENDLTDLQDQVDINTSAIAGLSAGLLKSVKVLWSNAALRTTTPLVLVPALAGHTYSPCFGAISFIYGGNDAFVGTPSTTFSQTSTLPSFNYTFTTDYQQKYTLITSGYNFASVDQTISLSVGLTGNASNDNYCEVYYYYYDILI